MKKTTRWATATSRRPIRRNMANCSVCAPRLPQPARLGDCAVQAHPSSPGLRRRHIILRGGPSKTRMRYRQGVDDAHHRLLQESLAQHHPGQHCRYVSSTLEAKCLLNVDRLYFACLRGCQVLRRLWVCRSHSTQDGRKRHGPRSTSYFTILALPIVDDTSLTDSVD